MVALVGKSTLAAAIAWFVGNDVIGAQTSAFAPFSAVLIMQVNVYQSMVQALRYVGAVCVGVALQAGLGFLFGSGVATFTLVALIALTIGRWRRLAAQGQQVATAAFFAFGLFVTAGGVDARLSQLGEIIVLVLVGCAAGLVVNVIVLPPMRYRSAEYGVRALACALHDLIEDIHPVLREGELDSDHTGPWRQRATQLRQTSDQAQAGVDAAWEDLYYNPRRLLTRRTRSVSFSGYQELVEALQRTTYQIGSLTRSLDQQHDDVTGAPNGTDFLRRYADLLAQLCRLTAILGDLDEDHLPEQAKQLHSATEEAERLRLRLTEQAEDSGLPLSDPTRPYAILLAEAIRLTEEFQHTADVLDRTLTQA